MSSVCRICFAGNTSLQSVKSNLLRRLYEKLTNAKFDPEDARPRDLCCYCYQKLLRCHTFSQMAVRSEEILNRLYDRGLEVTHDHKSEVTRDMKQHLSVSAMKPINIDGNDTNAASQVTVKDEPLPSVDTQEDVTSEPDKLLEVEIFPEYCTKSELTFKEDISDREDDIEELLSYTHIDQYKPDDSSLTINDEPHHRIHLKEEVTTHLDKLVEVDPAPELSTKCQVKNKFACHLCNKTVDYKGSLVRHIRTHTVEKPFTCNVCEKQFNLKGYLVNHIIRNHTVEKPFACNVCDKKFNRNDHLVSHMRTHTGEKPFACNVCDKKFKRKDHLVSHKKRTHTGEKPFACDVCDIQFSQKVHLVSHKRIHTGEKPFACNVCNKKFKRKDYLVTHKRTHTDKKSFARNIKSTPTRLAPAGERDFYPPT